MPHHNRRCYQTCIMKQQVCKPTLQIVCRCRVKHCCLIAARHQALSSTLQFMPSPKSSRVLQTQVVEHNWRPRVIACLVLLSGTAVSLCAQLAVRLALPPWSKAVAASAPVTANRHLKLNAYHVPAKVHPFWLESSPFKSLELAKSDYLISLKA